MPHRRKYPAFLPGKELEAIHFEIWGAAEASPERIKKEVGPLIDFALKKRWISEGEAEATKENLARKDPDAIWSVAESWGAKLNWARPEESAAVAGWIVMRNLVKARLLWQGYRRPYNSLRPSRIEDYQRALRLACAFEKYLPESERDGERHLFGLAILLLEPSDHKLAALGRETLGEASIETQGPDKLLAITHGMPAAGKEGWVRADLETVKLLRQKLQKDLSEQQRDGISAWRRKLYLP